MWSTYPSYRSISYVDKQTTNQNVQTNRHGPYKKGCNQASMELRFTETDRNGRDALKKLSKRTCMSVCMYVCMCGTINSDRY